MSHILDNPAWHSLTGPHAKFAIGAGSARHYPRDMSIFSALAESTPEAYADLAVDLPPFAEARLFRPAEEQAPPGWEVVNLRPILQMLAPSHGLVAARPIKYKMISLGLDDAGDMMALAQAAKPGPFGPRTVEMGAFVGVRDESGRLVAMAGERLLLPGYVELSKICVLAEATGQGLGRALIVHLANAAFDRHLVPFLHVLPDSPAWWYFERLGFMARTKLWTLWHRPIPNAGAEGAEG